jgi:hypothetical protein
MGRPPTHASVTFCGESTMNNKLTLDVADLRVESFPTEDDAAGPRGTVRAHDSGGRAPAP